MINIINKWFFGEEKEPTEAQILGEENPPHIKKELLWYWTKYIDDSFFQRPGYRPMTLKEWQEYRIRHDDA